MNLVADGKRLDAVWLGPPPDQAPTLVFLHEGLGSVSLWRDFPSALCDATGMGGLVFSRAGYGQSDPVSLPRPLDYMQHEGEVVLPQVLRAAGVRRAMMVGHSDGASVALVYAGTHPAAEVELLGLVLEAPHVFCEDLSVRSIAKAREEFERGDLRARLARHHGANVDVAFRGWNDAWLDPAFRAWTLESHLPRVRCPVLVIQGAEDPYGTLRQVETITRSVGGPAEALILDACGHAPHRDQRAKTLEAMASASRRWLAGVTTVKSR